MAPKNSQYITLPVIAVLALFVFVESIDFYKDITALDWPTTTGDLSYVNVPAPSSYSMPEYGPIFHPLRSRIVLYSYNVGQKQYESSDISFGYTFSENLEIVKKITPNHIKVKVYYNKTNPEEAVLIPGPKFPNVFLILAPLFLILWMVKQMKLETSDAQQSAAVGLCSVPPLRHQPLSSKGALMEPITDESLRKGYQLAVIICCVMIASLFVYFGVAEFLVWQNKPFNGYAPLPADVYRNLLIVLFAIAIFNLALIPFIRNRFLSAAGRSRETLDYGPPSVQSLVSASMVSFALCESIAIYGLVLFLMNGLRRDFYLFIIIALAAFVLHFPRYERWKEWTGYY